MSEELAGDSTGLAPSGSTTVPGTPSPLVQRGLSDIEQDAVTPERIRGARSERPEFRGLSDEAIKIALEESKAWEYRLFLQVLTDELARYDSLREALDSGATLGEIETIRSEDM